MWGISAQRMYVAVASPYPPGRGITRVYLVAKCRSFCASTLSLAILQINNDKIPSPDEVSRQRTSPIGRWTLGVGNVLDKNLPSELELCGFPQVNECIGVIIFESGDLFELASGDFRLQSEVQL